MRADYRRPQVTGERSFLERLAARLPPAPAGEVWLGDDAAVLDGGLLLATDALVAGVHFDLDWSTPSDVGWKALVVNLSDLAAMAGSPRAAVVAVVVPPRTEGLADEVLDGLAEAAEAHRCPLVGGDTTSGAELVVSVAVLGTVGEGGPVLRSGARAGDAVFVTGTLGGARRALRLLREGSSVPGPLRERLDRPQPQLAAGEAAAASGATAMIDVSDGLGTDLGRVLDASGVGVRVDAALIPRLDAFGVGVEDALAGGDDYQLCFTAPDPDRVARSFHDRNLPPPVAIGEVVAEDRVVVRDGSETPWVDSGWEHSVP